MAGKDEADFFVTREASGRRHLHVTYSDGTGEVFAFDRMAAARLARDLADDELPMAEARRIKQ